MRKCRICGRSKPLNEFRWRSDSGKHRTICVRCENAGRKKRADLVREYGVDSVRELKDRGVATAVSGFGEVEEIWANTKKECSPDFFDVWSLKMAYVLGLTLTDGCVSVGKGYSISFCFRLKYGDGDYLCREIKNVFKSNSKIRTIPPDRHWYEKEQRWINSSGKRKISIGGKQKVMMLVNKFNLQSPKSLKVFDFSLVPSLYFGGVLRGCLDGDGQVLLQLLGNPGVAWWSVSEGTLISMRDRIFEVCGAWQCVRCIESKKYPHRTKMFRLQYNALADVYRLTKLMYFSCVGPALPRKKRVLMRSVRRWEKVELHRMKELEECGTRTKQCPRCGEGKFLYEFCSDVNKKDGRSTICKICKNGYCRKSYSENKIKLREKSRLYYHRKREELNG